MLSSQLPKLLYKLWEGRSLIKRYPMKYIFYIWYFIKLGRLVSNIKWYIDYTLYFSWYLHSYLNVQLWWHCWPSSKQDIGCVHVACFEEKNGLQDILLCTQFIFLDSPITKIVLNIQKAFHDDFCTCLDLVTPVTFKSSYEIRGYQNYRDR